MAASTYTERLILSAILAETPVIIIPPIVVTGQNNPFSSFSTNDAYIFPI